MNRFEGFSGETASPELPDGAVEVVSEETTHFRQEMAKMQTDPTVATENLKRVNVELLNDTDRAMWEKLQTLLNRETISAQERGKFFEEVQRYRYEAGMDDESRGYFSGFIANQSMALLRKPAN